MGTNPDDELIFSEQIGVVEVKLFEQGCPPGSIFAEEQQEVLVVHFLVNVPLRKIFVNQLEGPDFIVVHCIFESVHMLESMESR